MQQQSRSFCGDDVSEKLIKASEFEVKILMLSLSIYWKADRQSNPSGWLAAHFAGRWQTIRHTNLCLLMTLKHETKLYAGPSDLCESISKIILLAVATHFRLPPPMMALSSEDDRLELRAVQGRVCSIPRQCPWDLNPFLSSVSPHHLHLLVLGLLHILTTLETLSQKKKNIKNMLCAPLLHSTYTR